MPGLCWIAGVGFLSSIVGLADGAEITIAFSFLSGPAQSPGDKLALFSGALLAVSCEHRPSR
jgi:hypothetical protein